MLACENRAHSPIHLHLPNDNVQHWYIWKWCDTANEVWQNISNELRRQVLQNSEITRVQH